MVEKLGDSLTGCTVHPEDFEETNLFQLFTLFLHGVRFLQGRGMIQVLVNPVFEEVKVAKIDNKSVVVQFLCPKSQGYSPTVTV